jgi:hypothetical protein
MQDTESPSEVNTIWQLKPWWCQPWSILLTGVVGVGLSWIWLQRWWITILVSAAVLAWWGLFLILVPRAWKEAVEEKMS